MKKILIIENINDDFRLLQETLEHDLLADVFPKTINNQVNDLSNNNVLIDTLIEGRFDEVLGYYNDIDLFIIDVMLRDDSDEIGIRFGEYILENPAGGGSQILFISNAISSHEIFDTSHFLSKQDSDYLNISVRDKVVEILAPTNARSLLRVDALAAPKRYDRHKRIEASLKNANRWIGHFITVCFQVLLFFTALYAVVHILYTMLPSTGQNDTSILQTSEHIFLYILPVFIVFGFYYYYKSNPNVFLLGGKPNKSDEQNSEKTMNLTKLLFLSSMISYILIKTIEVVFFPVSKVIDMTQMIAAGSLLIVLMAYYVVTIKNK